MNKAKTGSASLKALVVEKPLARKHGPYDLVFANIPARPLAAIRRRPAGLPDRQNAMIVNRYRAEGLKLAEEYRRNGWRVLRRRRPGSAI